LASHLFASDNASGVAPEVLHWLTRASRDHVSGYGSDRWTRQAEQAFAEHFGTEARVFMVTTGTACNVLALQSGLCSTDALFCSDVAHVHVDECGAPERMIGCKLVSVASVQGKLDLPQLQAALIFQNDLPHRNRPAMVSLSQATEYGTLYSIDELRSLVRWAHRHGLKVHLDGARLANAAVALNVSLAALSRDVGVDVLSFGGTKNGLMMAEAVICFDDGLATCFEGIRKQGMQLVSKHRFLAAQFLAYFENDLWQTHARQANAMARLLRAHLAQCPQVRLTAPTQVNMVFVEVPETWVQPLQAYCACNRWLPGSSELRFVTSFDTTEADIAALIQHMQRLAS